MNNPVNLSDPSGESPAAAVALVNPYVLGAACVVGAYVYTTNPTFRASVNDAVTDIVKGTGTLLNKKSAEETSKQPSVDPSKWVEKSFGNPSNKPGPDWEWRGPQDKGSWYNPKTGESMHPDLQHGKPQGPHWDYTDPKGKQFRVNPDGTMVPK